MEKLLRNGFMRALLLVMLAGVAGQTAYGAQAAFGGSDENVYSYPELSQRQVDELARHVDRASKLGKKSDVKMLPGIVSSLNESVVTTLKSRTIREAYASPESLDALNASVTAFAKDVNAAATRHAKKLGTDGVDALRNQLGFFWNKMSTALGYEAAPSEPSTPRTERRLALQAEAVRQRQAASVAGIRGGFEGYTASAEDAARLRDQFRFEHQHGSVPERRSDTPPASPMRLDQAAEVDGAEDAIVSPSSFRGGSMPMRYDAPPATVAGFGFFTALDALLVKYAAGITEANEDQLKADLGTLAATGTDLTEAQQEAYLEAFKRLPFNSKTRNSKTNNLVVPLKKVWTASGE